MVECALNSYGIRMGKLQLAVNAIRNPHAALSGFVPGVACDIKLP